MKKNLVFAVMLVFLVISGCSSPKLNFNKDNLATATAIATPEPSKQPHLSPSPIPSPSPTAKPPEVLRITAVGDILLGRGVQYYLKNSGKDYIYPFEKVSGILKKGDIVFANLEESITDSVHGLLDINEGGKYVLKNESAAFAGILSGGFNLLNIANNHILDFYDTGLKDTLNLLDKNNIAYAGAGRNLDEAKKPAIIERKGIKVGMLAYTDMAEITYKGNPQLKYAAGIDKYGVSPRSLNSSDVIKDMEKVRGSVDILIISLHWGVEESFQILKEQRQYAYDLLDAGADMILGHHPHQFQGIEMYKGKPIVYSLGNFIFDQNDPENQEAFILEMAYQNKQLTSFTAVPVRTIAKTQVVPVYGKDAEELLKRQIRLCSELGTECRIENDKLVLK